MVPGGDVSPGQGGVQGKRNGLQTAPSPDRLGISGRSPQTGGEHMGDTPQGAPARPLGWFAHLRALLVALHLVAITVLAAPSVGEGLSRWAWQDPTVQDEFADWTGRLNRWGVAITRQQF